MMFLYSIPSVRASVDTAADDFLSAVRFPIRRFLSPVPEAETLFRKMKEESKRPLYFSSLPCYIDEAIYH